MRFFKNLYDYRELLKTSVQKDVRGKYKNSVLGVLWSFLNPLLQICVYWFVFGMIMGSSEPNYVVFLCCGLIPWTFFAATINRNAFIFIENGYGKGDVNSGVCESGVPLKHFANSFFA